MMAKGSGGGGGGKGSGGAGGRSAGSAGGAPFPSMSAFIDSVTSGQVGAELLNKLAEYGIDLHGNLSDVKSGTARAKALGIKRSVAVAEAKSQVYNALSSVARSQFEKTGDARWSERAANLNRAFLRARAVANGSSPFDMARNELGYTKAEARANNAERRSRRK